MSVRLAFTALLLLPLLTVVVIPVAAAPNIATAPSALASGALASTKPVLSCSSPPVDLSRNPTGLSSNDTDESGDPVIAGNMVYVVWSTQNQSTKTSEVFLAVSSDLGATFSAPVLLSDPSTNARSAKLAASGSSVYATWVGDNSVYFRASQDYGATFGARITLSGTGTALGETIAVSQSTGEVLVAWLGASSPSGPNGVYASVSRDDGKSFSAAQLLSRSGDSAREISVATSDANLYVTWIDSTVSPAAVMFRASHDGGTTFEPALDVSNGAVRSLEPILSATDGNGYVYVVWREQFVAGGDSEPFISGSSDYGATFGKAVDLVSNNTAETREVAVASSGPNVYVIWRNPISGTYRVYFVASYDGGATFGAAKDLSGRTGIRSITYQYVPSIAVVPGATPSKDTVYVTWDSVVSGAHDVFLTKSTNGGRTFSAALNVSNDPTNSWSEMVAATPNSSFVMWLDGPSTTPAHFDVFGARCT